jgi:hypothetical protein
MIPDWPKLAWLAKCPKNAGMITVYHGPCVETHEQWCVEAAWAGNFAEGNFDQTDLIFGSGIRCRTDQVVFVSSGTTEDRLWHCQKNEFFYASNSLPCLLAGAKLKLRDDYPYSEDIRSISSGVKKCVRSIPTVSESIQILYFHNLVYDGNHFKEVEKPDTVSSFETYSDYYNFLVSSAQILRDNLKNSNRRYPIIPLATVSTGYDSCAAAVIAKHAGCQQAVTIEQSTSFWRGSDSGMDVACQLGLACKTYNRTAKRYPLEETIWSVNGRAGTVNWTLFDYPEPLCLLFTGSYGDGVWDRRRIQLADPLAGAAAGLGGLCEFRLFKGIFICSVPFWGRRHFNEVQNISFSKEMGPWTLYNDYDRPIPRRIVEEAGVFRDAFGKRKKNTSLETPFLWPYSPETKARFRKFLKNHNLYAPSDIVLAMIRLGSYANSIIYTNLTRRLGWSNIGERYLKFKAHSLLFYWSNHELCLHYERSYLSNMSLFQDHSQENII